MPMLGYGVFQVSPEECEHCVADALSVGYRLIDTAQAYRNEEGVGAAVAKSGIPREEIFLVSKIWMSNFYPDHLIDLAHNFEVKPTVNQVETHVFNQQVEASKYMAEIGTVPMAWGPFAEGKNGIFTNDTLVGVGAKYGKTAAQVALRYLIQRGVIVIPKSSKKERMAQNIDVFDFKLSAEDMDAILKLDTGKPVVMPSHHDPEIVKWFMTLL